MRQVKNVRCWFNHFGGQSLRFYKLTEDNIKIERIDRGYDYIELWTCKHCNEIVFKRTLFVR